LSVSVIILAVIAVSAASIDIIVFQPAMFELAYETSFWEGCDGNPQIETVHVDLCIWRDSLYSATIAIPIFALGVIAVYSYLAMSRGNDL
jgi:hypothetical protein